MNDIQPHNGSGTKRVADVDRKQVLVIDDDMPLRGMLAAALRQAGFKVLLAGDGGEGHRALTIHRPDVILLDLAMPGVNGWDFLQRLKETGYLGTVPIIVLSAHLHVEPQAILQLGVAAILPKPFNLPELIDLIEHLSP
jgi:DNA-binding response OmpR family regulator